MFVIAMFLVLPLDKEQYGQFCLWGIVIWKKVGRGGGGYIFYSLYIAASGCQICYWLWTPTWDSKCHNMSAWSKQGVFYLNFNLFLKVSGITMIIGTCGGQPYSNIQIKRQMAIS